jgi:hypothetical protein
MSTIVKKSSLRSPHTITHLPAKASISLVVIALLQSCTFSPTFEQNFDENKPLPEFGRNIDFSHELEKLQENSLKALPNKDCSAVYRFLWLRAFHNWISIRVEHHKDGTTKVYAKEFGRKESAPESLLKDLSFDWSPAKYQTFARQIEEMGFWNSPSTEAIKSRELSTDGAAWILEGVDQNRYHVIARGTATIKRSGLRHLGLYLLKETNLLPPKEQTY